VQRAHRELYATGKDAWCNASRTPGPGIQKILQKPVKRPASSSKVIRRLITTYPNMRLVFRMVGVSEHRKLAGINGRKTKKAKIGVLLYKWPARKGNQNFDVGG
jgi:hypothetical protein